MSVMRTTFAVAVSSAVLAAAFADTNITENVTLLEDADWRGQGTVSIASGATLDIGDVDQTVTTLTLAGRLQKKGAATWGAIGSGAKYETPMITGSGILRVKGPGRGLVIIVK